MKNTIAIILLVLGLGLVIYGLASKEDQQADINIAGAELEVGKSDRAFSGYFIVGGLMAVAGVIMMAAGKRS